MPTITQPKRQATVTKAPVQMTPFKESEAGRLLGIKPSQRGPVMAELRARLTECSALLRGAPLAPQRAHQVAAHEQVRKDAARLYKTISELPDHHRNNIPDADVFLTQLGNFHDQLQFGLIQMRGRGSQRGGGKQRTIARTRQAVEHSLGMFFDLNAVDGKGRLRSDSIKATGPIFLPERLRFVEYCMGLIDPTAS
jgi:hypothetical protein